MATWPKEEVIEMIGREYRPENRVYDEISEDVKQQLMTIEPTNANGASYWPCAVLLRSGATEECVYIVSADEYINQWGVWPDEDKAKRAVDIREVIRIVESPHRLPARFANILYRAGESGMGYAVFEIEFEDDSRQPYTAGNALDFIPLPPRKSMAEIRSVHPHSGRTARNRLEGLPYFWCLFGRGDVPRWMPP
jgi:hypothetical protein